MTIVQLFHKIVRKFLILVLVFAWLFGGWPQISSLAQVASTTPVAETATTTPDAVTSTPQTATSTPPADVLEEEIPAQEVIESPIIPQPPPLKIRTFSKHIELDKKARHSCRAEVFRVDMSSNDRANERLLLAKNGDAPYEVEIGSLPAGIDIIFGKNGDYV